jgi:uncharacterized Zn-finger protein
MSAEVESLLEKAMLESLVTGIVQCAICGSRLSKKKHLKTHLQNLHGSDKYCRPCPACGKFYKNTQTLRIHLGTQHKGYKYSL